MTSKDTTRTSRKPVLIMPQLGSSAMPDTSTAVNTGKRKRDGDDGDPPIHSPWMMPKPQPPQSASEPSIKYHIDSSLPKLRLIPAGCPELLDIITTIETYDNVLGHHESLAARLGAQMASPKLLKALDSLFEGSVTTVQCIASGRPLPTWMEVVAFAKAEPSMFKLHRAPDGTGRCQFSLRGFSCTISENDWRLIASGAVDRFGLVPNQGTPEDEAAELAALEIVDERLQTFITQADKLAEKARQAKYRLSKRKAGIMSGRLGPSQPE